jgi:hypothetical protein
VNEKFNRGYIYGHSKLNTTKTELVKKRMTSTMLDLILKAKERRLYGVPEIQKELEELTEDEEEI